MESIDKICENLYNGEYFKGPWHGHDQWGKSSDFHEHPFFMWRSIQQFFGEPLKPLNIVETGRCSGQSTILLSAIAQQTGGMFYSFDPQDWNRQHILNTNKQCGVVPGNYIVDLSFNAPNHLPADFKIDVLFLDSLHTYECVKKETEILDKYLAPKSIIFFHDTTWCFDSVLGWIKDYLADKEVSYVRHPDTSKPQCALCTALWGQPGQAHGRPQMIGNRPHFQSHFEVVDSPHFNTLSYDWIKWSDKSFDEALKTEKMVFTNIEASCGIGALFING